MRDICMASLSFKKPTSYFSDHTHLFAQLIARTAKDIEVLIDSLPSEESSAELQSASLIKLEEENREAAKRLEDIVQQVQKWPLHRFIFDPIKKYSGVNS